MKRSLSIDFFGLNQRSFSPMQVIPLFPQHTDTRQRNYTYLQPELTLFLLEMMSNFTWLALLTFLLLEFRFTSMFVLIDTHAGSPRVSPSQDIHVSCDTYLRSKGYRHGMSARNHIFLRYCKIRAFPRFLW